MIKNKNFVWNAIGTILNSFLSLFLLIIVTRINGIELSGSFSFIFTLTLIIQTISNYGGRIYQVSDLNDEFEFQEYLGSRVLTSILSIIVVFICHLIYKFDNIILYTTICLIIFRIIETFSDVFYGNFQKQNHLDWVGISLTIKSVLILILFFTLNKIFNDLFISSLGIVIAALIVFVFFDLIKVTKSEKIYFSFFFCYFINN